ncbi:MAG: hypothetical protein ACYS8Z_19490 [Planctomycetota bacterium]|jgi:hypothetical protein
MKRTILVTVIAFLTAAASIASAELVQGISIDFVTIGNPGNPGNTRTLPARQRSVCIAAEMKRFLSGYLNKIEVNSAVTTTTGPSKNREVLAEIYWHGM